MFKLMNSEVYLCGSKRVGFAATLTANPATGLNISSSSSYTHIPHAFSILIDLIHGSHPPFPSPPPPSPSKSPNPIH